MPSQPSPPFSQRAYPPPEADPQADRLQDLVGEWLRRAFGGEGVLWGSVWQLVRHPGRLTRDWWEGRRSGRMSPVRMLFLALLLDTVVTVGEARIFGAVPPAFSGMLRAMTYILAAATVVVTLAILPGMLPAGRQQTLYRHATFALYEAAFLSLFILWGFASVLMLAVIPPAQLAAARIVLAPLSLVGLAAFLVHSVAHLRRAYALSWVQAAWRAAVLLVATVTAVFVISGLMDLVRAAAPTRAAGPVRVVVHHRQMERNDQLGAFRRVPAEQVP